MIAIITRNDEQIEVEVDYTLSPRIRGDRWEPQSGGEVEDYTAYIDGKRVQFAGAEQDAVITAIYDYEAR